MHSMRTINMHTKNVLVMVGDVTIRMIIQAWCLIVPIFLYNCFSVHPFLFSPVTFTLIGNVVRSVQYKLNMAIQNFQ